MNPESPFTQGGGQPNFQPMPTPPSAPQPGYAPVQPAPIPPIVSKVTNTWKVVGIIAIIVAVLAIAGGIWLLISYLDQKNNVDSKVTSAVATAVKEEQDQAAAHLLEVENNPNRLFAGPDDYGHLTFNYSKLWSVYIDKDAAAGGTYAAYLNPVAVPPVSDKERYALRVSIEEKDYDKVVSSYDSLVKKGDLKASTFKIDDTTSATRLDGNFTKDIRGSALIFKIRDKTATLRTDAETFKDSFDALIKTIQYNK